MNAAWLGRAEVERLLFSQAEGVAAHLGHKLGTWEVQREEGVWLARCRACADTARVAVRRFRRPPIAGAAVELRCTGRREGLPAEPAGPGGPSRA